MNESLQLSLYACSGFHSLPHLRRCESETREDNTDFTYMITRLAHCLTKRPFRWGPFLTLTHDFETLLMPFFFVG